MTTTTRQTSRALLLTLGLLGTLACQPADATPLGLPPLPAPADSPARIRLGERLFHDQRLSSTGQIACASCHLDSLSFQDGRPVSRGVNLLRGTRNAPTVLNAAYLNALFWDGRASSLEQQAMQPLLNAVEHGWRNEVELLQQVRSDAAYLAQFREAYGIAPEQIGLVQVAGAIAAYERTLLSGGSAFDRWRYGGETQALDDAARRGFTVFTGAGQCASCHLIGEHSALFTDQAFHNLGIGLAPLAAEAERLAEVYRSSPERPPESGLTEQQIAALGRYTVSHRHEDIGAFRTPSLRNVARTAPYMHDGSFRNLESVIDYFDRGGDPAGRSPSLSRRLQPLHLSVQQKQDLLAFLMSLDSPPPHSVR